MVVRQSFYKRYILHVLAESVLKPTVHLNVHLPRSPNSTFVCDRPEANISHSVGVKCDPFHQWKTNKSTMNLNVSSLVCSSQMALTIIGSLPNYLPAVDGLTVEP